MNITVLPDAWIRNRRQTVGFGSLSIAFGAFWVGLTIYFLSGSQNSDQSAATRGIVAAFALLLAFGFVLFGIRQLRAGLWIGADQTVIRGPLRVQQVPTDQVNGFVVGRALAPCAVLQQSQGRPVPVSALMRGGWRKAREPLHAKELEPVCEQLNGVLASLQTENRPALAGAGAGAAAQQGVSTERDAKLLLVAILAVFWLVAAGVVILVSNAAVTAIVGAIVLADTAWTLVALSRGRPPGSSRAKATAKAEKPPS